MDNKKHSLLGRLGSSMDEAVGVRDGETTRPAYDEFGSHAVAPTNFRVDREMGTIDASDVFPDPKQPRKEFDDRDLRSFGEEIRLNGQLQPIGVRWDAANARWLIIYGERRWRAIQAAGIAEIKCRFYQDELSESQIRSIQLTENIQRKDLKPIEEAKGYRVLMRLNKWKAKELAESLNVSANKVGRALKLLTLPDEVQDEIDAGKIAPSVAYEITKEKEPDKRSQLIEKARNGDLQQKTARKVTNKSKRGDGTKTRRSTNREFKVEKGIRVVVSGRKFVGEQGVIDALLQALEQQRAAMTTEQKKAA
jgi:ParB family chromosome partitioning protein